MSRFSDLSQRSTQERESKTALQRRSEPNTQHSETSAPSFTALAVAERSPVLQLRAFGDAVAKVQHAIAENEARNESSRQVQLRGGERTSEAAAMVHESAQHGMRGGGGSLPFADEIQSSFGPHDISGIRAHTGVEAREANESIGSMAYASGQHVAFCGTPDLFTAAHEAAHMVQQRGASS